MPGIKHRRWIIYRLDILSTVFCFLGTVLPTISLWKMWEIGSKTIWKMWWSGNITTLTPQNSLYYIRWELMNNYYPLSWVSRQLWDEEVKQMLVTPTERKGWSYLFATTDGEWLKVETNIRHTITSVAFTPHYRSLWRSLRIAKTKGFRIARYTHKLVSVEN